jgi:hypothetical protein
MIGDFKDAGLGVYTINGYTYYSWTWVTNSIDFSTDNRASINLFATG